jgi:hypothetical protein
MCLDSIKKLPRAKKVGFVAPDKGGDAERPLGGTNHPRIRAIQAAMKEMDTVWAWSSARQPMIMERRTMGSSNFPMLAGVARRAERFISRYIYVRVEV